MTVLTLIEHARGRALAAGVCVRRRRSSPSVAAVTVTGDAYAPAGVGQTLVDLIAQRSPTAVVAPGSDRGNEVMAHVAAQLDQPMAANCVSLTPGDPATVVRVRWGGSLLEEARAARLAAAGHRGPHAVAAAPAPEVEIVQAAVRTAPSRSAST